MIIAHDGDNIAKFLLVDSNNYLQTILSGELPAGTQTIGSVKVTDGTKTLKIVDWGDVTGASDGGVVVYARDQDNGTFKFLDVDASSNLLCKVNVALPAGTNNIGDVDAIQSGTWIVGLSTGTNSIGKVDLNAPTTPYNGQTTVTTAGTRVQLTSSQTALSVVVKANDDNAGLIYLGGSTVSSVNGLKLSAGDSVPIDIANLSTFWIDSAEDGDGVSWLGVG